MTIEEVVEAAFARAMQFSDTFPTTRSVLYRRIGVRQHQLFASVAAIDPDYFGVCVTGPLVGGAADFRAVEPAEGETVPASLELVQKIEVDDPGTSAYAAGDEIHPVALLDAQDAALPPRATLRDGVLRQVGTDLDGVATVTLHYAKQSRSIAADADPGVEVELPLAHQELLVVDLTRHLLRQTMSLDPNAKSAAIAMLEEEENELLLALEKHVQGFRGAHYGRFA